MYSFPTGVTLDGRVVSVSTYDESPDGLTGSCGQFGHREDGRRGSAGPGAWRGGRAARCALAPEGIPAAGGPSDTTARTAFRAAWEHSERPAHGWFCGRIPEPNSHLSLGKKWATENAGPQTRSRTLSAAPRRLRRELTSRPRVGARGSARRFASGPAPGPAHHGPHRLLPAHHPGPAPPPPPAAARRTPARMGAALRRAPAAAQPPKPVREAARLRQQPGVTLGSAAEGGRPQDGPDAEEGLPASGGLTTAERRVAELHAAACAVRPLRPARRARPPRAWP